MDGKFAAAVYAVNGLRVTESVSIELAFDQQSSETSWQAT